MLCKSNHGIETKENTEEPSLCVLLSTGQGVLGHNAYAYCLGNPGNMTDDKGTESTEALKQNNTYQDRCGGSLIIAYALIVAAAYVAPSVSVFITDRIDDLVDACKDATKQLKNQITYSKTRDQSVYVMLYKDGELKGEIGYVGRTNDISRRKKEHRNDPSKGNLDPPMVIMTGLTVDEARVVEQLLISTYVMGKLGGDLLNTRREISIRNLKKYIKDFHILVGLVEGYNESEILCAMGR